MSGPIVRKYGFPNFEKIFGERKLKHGAEDEEKRESAEKPDGAAQAQQDAGSSSDHPAPRRATESKA